MVRLVERYIKINEWSKRKSGWRSLLKNKKVLGKNPGLDDLRNTAMIYKEESVDIPICTNSFIWRWT